MGRFSELSIALAEEGPGYHRIMGRHVCAGCFEDSALKSLIEARAKEHRCDYCGSTSDRPVATGLDEIVSHIRISLEREWVDADTALPRDPETGEFMLEPTIDTATLLAKVISLELPNDTGALLDDIVSALPDCAWCRNDPLVSTPDEAIGNSWRAFCQVIRHQRRFFFMQHDAPDLVRDIEQADAAYTIPELLEALVSYSGGAGLFAKVDAGTVYFRCQAKVDPDEPAYAPERMASPPLSRATQANRMSPPGISMFYGAEAVETALAEIASEPGHFAAGEFRLLRDARLLDLRHTPEVPSLFDAARAAERPFALFMHEFLDDFRKPIEDGDRKHVDYVPTQVVTEYFRSVARVDNAPIDGILYASSKLPGAAAVVLFADNAAVVRAVPLDPWDLDSDTKPWLEMVGYREGWFNPAHATFQ